MPVEAPVIRAVPFGDELFMFFLLFWLLCFLKLSLSGLVELEVVRSQWPAALTMVTMTLVHYARPVPFPQGKPAQSAGCTGQSGQVERPLRMRLACNVARNRSLSNGYRKATDFSHYVKRDQEVE